MEHIVFQFSFIPQFSAVTNVVSHYKIPFCFSFQQYHPYPRSEIFTRLFTRPLLHCSNYTPLGDNLQVEFTITSGRYPHRANLIYSLSIQNINIQKTRRGLSMRSVILNSSKNWTCKIEDYKIIRKPTKLESV